MAAEQLNLVVAACCQIGDLKCADVNKGNGVEQEDCLCNQVGLLPAASPAESASLCPLPRPLRAQAGFRHI